MAKNIVVLSDGTGKQGGFGENTNVYKLFNLLEDRKPDQIPFYVSGLGGHGVGGQAAKETKKEVFVPGLKGMEKKAEAVADIF